MTHRKDRRSPNSPQLAATAPSTEEVAAAFRALVDKRFGSQLRASKALGIPRVTLQRVLAGEQLPGAPLLQALAAAGVDVNALLLAGREPGEPTPFAEPGPPSGRHEESGASPWPALDRSGGWPVETAIVSGVLPLFDVFLPGEPSGYAGRSLGDVAVPEAWARPGSYAVWLGEAKRSKKLIFAEEGLCYPEQRPEVANDVLIVWTGRIPDWVTASPLAGAARRKSVRHTFAGQERIEAYRQESREISAAPVVLYRDVPVLSLVHRGVSYRRENDKTGKDKLYAFAEFRGGASEPDWIKRMPVAGFAVFSLGRFRAGAGRPG
ncbi:hypothetical protein [Alienimonas chondri]|uniref:HTH cro/C1-type domain-containing protein n=1 Tax=Alienimonas chondri TaxID=2681879 RepID=A0ABX1VJW7_9PLAN|nr:hypothetical protein [Alienimonas chondri]NNJ27726.1 hypothetical protein [Alienimonas chondri]